MDIQETCQLIRFSIKKSACNYALMYTNISTKVKVRFNYLAL